MTADPLHTLDPPKDYGVHKGLPILRQSAVIQNGARVVSQTMGVVDLEVEPNGDRDIAARLHQTKERFDNIVSKDEDHPGTLIGYERVIIFDMVGATPDDRPGTAKMLATTMEKVAEEQERIAAAKKGQKQFTLSVVDPDPGAA